MIDIDSVSTLKKLLEKNEFNSSDIAAMLSVETDEEIEVLRTHAYNIMRQYVGEKVFLRGLVEFSNICALDCYYCGIRKSNKSFERYNLTKDEIITAAKWCASRGYGSMVLQGGERRDEKVIDFLVDVISTIKQVTVSDHLPYALGVTLSVGEQSLETYRRLFDAGAHRYLLRIETSNSDLFGKIHPTKQSFESRIESMKLLKQAGFQLGTGVMIGLPGQTIEDLAHDIEFFRSVDADMIGMGPYIVHNDTPMKIYSEENNANITNIYKNALKMIAATRIVLKDVNIASTTALQAIFPFGREAGLRYGANIVMPQITPLRVRKSYLLYEGKPCVEDSAEDCITCLQSRIQSIGRTIGYNEYGDPKHFFKL